MITSLCFVTENPAHLALPRPSRQRNCSQRKPPLSLKLLVLQRQQELKLGFSAFQMMSPGALCTRSWDISRVCSGP